MNTYSLRRATVHDVPMIHQLTLEGIDLWATDIYLSLKPWVDTFCSQESIAHKVTDAQYEVYVTENDVLGVFGTVYIDLDECHMGGLYCGVRGQGLGTTLMQKVLDVAKSHNMDSLSCEIYENNLPSIYLMKKLGAVKVKDNPFGDVNYEEYRFDVKNALLAS